MGSSKPRPDDADTSNNPPHASSSSSHSLQPYADVDSELAPPPAYTEEDTTTPLPPAHQPKLSHHPSLPDPSNYFLPDSIPIKNTRSENRLVSYFAPTAPANPNPNQAAIPTTTHLPQTRHTTLSLSPTLSSNPSSLYSLLLTQSRLPPHLSVWVEGTHFETKGRGNGRKNEKITDFKFKIDVGGSLLRGWDLDDQDGKEWKNLKVVRDGDGEKAWRGGRVKSRGDTGGRLGIGGGGGFEGEGDLEQALMPTENEESGGELDALKTWCQRFCTDDSQMRSFTLTRETQNWDFPTVKSEIASLIRSLNYRGRISITSESTHHTLSIQTPHFINRARANSFIWWFCVIFQLWLITWPVIFLLEKKYSIVTSQWFTSRPDTSSYDPSTLTYSRTFARGRDEKEWVGYWACAIKEAALTRRKDGEVVGEGDVRRLGRENGDGVEVLRRAEMEADWERRGREIRGETGWMDTVTGIWRGLTGGWREEVDQVRGWGADRSF